MMVSAWKIMNRILVVEDDAEMATSIAEALNESGYDCKVAFDGELGLALAPEVDLILADIMMPKKNGLAMVEELRASGTMTPVIYVTAKDSTKDLVKGFESGGDDYLVKPFKLDELLARIKAILRRSQAMSRFLTFADVRIDRMSRKAYRGESELFLSATEFTLLEMLMLEPGSVVTKQSILQHIWKDEGYRDENIVEVYVYYLRRKTEAFGGARIVQTVKKKGYYLELSEQEP